MKQHAADPFAGLSRRERQVALRLGRGQSPTTIARVLGLSVKTVSTFRVRALRKLRLPNTVALMRRVVEFEFQQKHAPPSITDELKRLRAFRRAVDKFL